jgi:hypothetical protein
MWQRVWRRAWSNGVGTDSKDNGDLFSGHLNRFDQRPDNLSTPVPVGVSQPSPYLGGKCVKSTDEQLQVVGRVRLVGFLLYLLLEGRDPLTQPPQARLELHFVNQALGIGVNETAKSLAQLAQLRGRGVAVGLSGAVAHALGTPCIFGLHPRGIFEHRAHFRPNRPLNGRGGQRGRLTQRFAAEARGIPSATAIKR